MDKTQVLLLSVAYFRVRFVTSLYEIWTASLESIAIEEYRPIVADESSVVFTHEPLLSVAYFKSSLVES